MMPCVAPNKANLPLARAEIGALYEWKNDEMNCPKIRIDFLLWLLLAFVSIFGIFFMPMLWQVYPYNVVIWFILWIASMIFFSCFFETD